MSASAQTLDCVRGVKKDAGGCLEGNFYPKTSSMTTMGTESNALSFRWAMGGRIYTKTGDGYYYDLEGVKYRRSGKEG
jgi:hypothetical protein